jgi:hypothetical protein
VTLFSLAADYEREIHNKRTTKTKIKAVPHVGREY